MGSQGRVPAGVGVPQGSRSLCSVLAAWGLGCWRKMGMGPLEGLLAGLGHRHSTMLSSQVS